MQKLETRNGTLYFSESPETIPLSYYYHDGFDIIGEVAKEGITFDCQKYLWLHSEFNRHSMFLSMMCGGGIELREGYKFIVLKEK